MEPSSKPIERSAWVVARAGRLDGLLRDQFTLSWGKARELVRRGKVAVNGARVADTEMLVPVGAKIEVDPQARRVDGDRIDDDAIVYCDTHVVVVRKPAGISTVPYDEGERGTLVDRTRNWLLRRAGHERDASLGIVHRIDKETSGLVVFARTFLAKKKLAHCFRIHDIERSYHALVHGLLTTAHRIESSIVPDRGDGLRGAPKHKGAHAKDAQVAISFVEPVELLREATHLTCRLETGRTHQIRIHLSEAGHPLLGERVYIRDWLRAGRPTLEAPRLMLHAAVLGFSHPATGAALRFEEPLPKDMNDVIASLRGRAACR